MLARYNSDLANNLGNLLSRVTTVVQKKCGGIGPAPDPESGLLQVVAEQYGLAANAWQRVAPSEALDAVWRIIKETNSALEQSEPWKSDPGLEVDLVLGDALEVLRIVSILTAPVIPDSSAIIWSRIGLSGRPEGQLLPQSASWGQYPGGLLVTKGAPLFPRLK
jgi:methionyl-tRNA synthetase